MSCYACSPSGLERLPDVTVAVLSHPQSNLADFYREMGELFAAAQLLNLLHELLTGFENAYFDQLHRYYTSRSPLSKEPRPPGADPNEDPF